MGITNADLSVFEPEERERIQAELDKCWEEMNPYNCKTKEGQRLVKSKMMLLYHRDKLMAGLL